MNVTYLIASLAVYYLLNRPFLSLTCHQDAGWHSYWAAFRHKGVTLRQQMNMLLGCTRIGSSYWFVLLFSLFGIKDPDRLSRNVFLVLNYIAHVLLFFAVRAFAPANERIAYLIAGSYLILTSNPYWLFHYESAERTVNALHALFLLWIAFLPAASRPLSLFFLFFGMGLTGLFFKISQGAEYLFLWIFILPAHHKPSEIAAVIAGPIAAMGVFVMFLKARGLWSKENLGLFGYKKVSETYFHGNILMKAAAKLRIPGGQTIAKGLEGTIIGAGFTWLIKKLDPLRGFGITILTSSFVWWGLSLWTFTQPPAFPSLQRLGGLWLLGAFLSVIAQGSYIPLHFIPLSIPLAILSGLGLFNLIADIQSGSLGGGTITVLVLLAGAVLLMIKNLVPFFRRRTDRTKEALLWPPMYREVQEKNILASEMAAYIKSKTTPEDFVFVWGTVPQFHVMCERRSPVAWLDTSARMDFIFPKWKETMYQNIAATKPKFLVDFRGDVDLKEIEKNSGVVFTADKFFLNNKYGVYHMSAHTS